ncbi:MAG: exodeoxyribonuclease VII large subunit, partial [Verrucomicrobiota bacterium]
MDLFAPEPKVLSVSDLTRSVRSLLESEIGRVWVEGEIANFRKQASGHQYFTLKDDRSQVSCVLFYRPGRQLRQIPLADGMQVQVRGEMTVYEARGQYQLNVSLVQAAGVGLLQAKFEALKRKLESEGLFDQARKRSLPKFPVRIGIVTSPTGAAVRDMLNILQRRAPWVRVLVNPVRVQGDGAAEEIAAAIAEFNDFEKLSLPAVDVIVVCRGGGSAEDLW